VGARPPEGWPGFDVAEGLPADLPAAAVRIEPKDFTKVSALGVEEQRFRVILDFEGIPVHRMRMGDGYRVIAEFVMWEGPGARSVRA